MRGRAAGLGDFVRGEVVASRYSPAPVGGPVRSRRCRAGSLYNPPLPKPTGLDRALDTILAATVKRVQSESMQAAIEFLGAEPSDPAGAIKSKK